MSTATQFGRENSFYRQLHDFLRTRISSIEKMKLPNTRYWIKAFMCLFLSVTAYGIALAVPATYTWAMLVTTFFLMTLIFNTAHDASHQTMFGKKWANGAWFFSVFSFMGAHPYAWRVRHAGAHHLYPNVEGEDADLDNVFLLRLNKNNRHRWFHRYQHFYAPVLYASYSFYWLWIKDFIYPFSAIAARDAQRSRLRMLTEILAVKCIFITVHILIPISVGIAPTTVWTTFFICQVTVSLLFAFTFLITHYSMNVHTVTPVNGCFDYSWEMHQVQVSVDFSTRSKLANWIFGGFNHHITHHLFPHINHIHYSRITPWLYEFLLAHKIPFQRCSYVKGVITHFKLLKRFSVA